MSVASVGPSVVLPQSAKLASDGDPAAVEARETTGAKRAEQHDGGSAPKPAVAETATSSVPTATAAAGKTGVLNQIA